MSKDTDLYISKDYVPVDEEPFMNPHHLMYFKNKLSEWKQDILQETQETLENLKNESVNHPDITDRATLENDLELELQARERQRKLISKIDAALQRITDGTYGYCEETGEPIGLERLKARPIATLSIESQEKRERKQRIYRKEF